MTINEVKRQRVNAFKDLKRALRTSDSSLEQAERFINSILNRKNKMPTAEDLGKVISFLSNLDTNVGNLITLVSTLSTLFGAL